MWMIYTILGVAILGALAAGFMHYRKTRSALGAVQAGAESFIRLLAQRGMPDEANQLGHMIGEHVTKAGRWAKRINNALHATTKADTGNAAVTDATPADKRGHTRRLIAEAFRTMGRDTRP